MVQISSFLGTLNLIHTTIMRFSEDYFYEKYKILPKNVKRAMYSLNIHDIVKSITDKHKLHIDTAGILDDEIMFALLA